MGRTPAEIAEGAEGYWEGGNADTSELFSATALLGPETYAYTGKRYTFP